MTTRGAGGFRLLSAALLLVEFVAGIQTYLLVTVVPLVAHDLDAQRFYGLIASASLVAMFLTMPLAASMLARIRAGALFAWFTALAVLGGLVSAAAPNVWVFVLGRVLTGLSSGALMGVSLATIVTVLPPVTRRLVLAGYNVMWVISSLLGPLYAGWISSALSWRWALVIYLPLLVIARALIAIELRETAQSTDSGRAPVLPTLALTGGVTLISLLGVRSIPSAALIAAALAGALLIASSLSRLVPAGTLQARPGAPAALAVMGVLCLAYFGAANVLAIVAYDVLQTSHAMATATVAVAATGWAITGLYASKRPADTATHYARRSARGAALVTAGLIGCAAAPFATLPSSQIVLLGGALALGIGMGSTYLDTINRIVDLAETSSDLGPNEAATATVLVESVGTIIGSTVAATLIGRAIDHGTATGVTAAVFAGLVVVAAAVPFLAARARCP